jgi:hypothetical protein
MINIQIKSQKHIVTRRPFARQRLQHRSSVFCGPRMDHCYGACAAYVCMVTSQEVTHAGVFCRSTPRLCFLLWSMPSGYKRH